MTAPRPAIAPRMLTKEQAADYCGVSTAAFLRHCPVAPVSIGDDVRLNRYDVRLLDVWLDGFGPSVTTATDDLWIQQLERSL